MMSFQWNNVAVLFLALILKAPGVLAQCGGTTCDTCLQGFNCVWNVADNGTCQEACGGFPNKDCYYARTFGEGSTTAQICAAAADKVEENEVCFAKDTAQLCLQQAGCDWINGVIENGENRNWCALDVDFSPSDVPCSGTTCNECLGDSTCVWMKGDTCSNSCDNFPNVDCYYAKMFGATPDQSEAICNVANISMTENENCFNQTNQDLCFGVSGCAWLPTDANDPKNVGFCTLSLLGGGSGASSLLFHSGLFVFSLVAGWLVAV